MKRGNVVTVIVDLADGREAGEVFGTWLEAYGWAWFKMCEHLAVDHNVDVDVDSRIRSFAGYEYGDLRCYLCSRAIYISRGVDATLDDRWVVVIRSGDGVKVREIRDGRFGLAIHHALSIMRDHVAEAHREFDPAWVRPARYISCLADNCSFRVEVVTRSMLSREV